MPIRPGDKVKVKDTFPHKEDGGQYDTVSPADRAMRGRTGIAINFDTKYDNFVEFNDTPARDTGYFYDHELEVI